LWKIYFLFRDVRDDGEGGIEATTDGGDSREQEKIKASDFDGKLGRKMHFKR
jgi:hypothetical protein